MDQGPSDGEDEGNDEPHPDHIEDNDHEENAANTYCVCEHTMILQGSFFLIVMNTI